MRNKSHRNALIPVPAAAVAACLFAMTAQAAAQDKGCIELTTTAAVEQEFTDENGQPAKRVVPPGKVVPGDEIVWTITARNICAQPVENVVIGNPVPEHMRYVAASATGNGSAITYSLDGSDFRVAAALRVREADGSLRPARPDEYRHIRWTYGGALAPGVVARVSYRATVN